jgi:membrane protease YdiL (CAAX protease family)
VRSAPLKGRLIGWCAFVASMATLAYASHFTGGRPPKDVAYRWESSVAGVIQYAVILGIVLLLARGLDRRSFLGFRRPTSWGRAARISGVVLIIVFVVGAAVRPFGNPEKEQGLIPNHWDSSRAAQFVAYAAVVTIVAPLVEELMFRGVGYGLLEPFGRTAAILAVGLSFALIHGLVAGFPVIAAFGIGLAYLRAKTGSIYPCILLHAAFNTLGLALGIASGS